MCTATGRLAVLTALVIVLAGCGATAAPSAATATGAATGAPAATATGAATGTPGAVETPAATETAAFTPINLKGTGNRIAKFTIPEDAEAIAVITNRGSSNFSVWTVAASGSTNRLLVDEIGVYRGTRLFDASVGEHSVAFKIESDGTWSITVEPITSARAWNPAKAANGKGSMVLRVSGVLGDLAVMKIVHTGSSSFAVWTLNAEGRDLQVRKTGRYTGECIFPANTVLVEIEANGAWSITPG